MEFIVLTTFLTLANILPVQAATELSGKFDGRAPVAMSTAKVIDVREEHASTPENAGSLVEAIELIRAKNAG